MSAVREFAAARVTDDSPAPPFVTVGGAAVIAAVHPETVRDAARAGELHGYQPRKGATWKFRPSCVEAWVEGEPCEHQDRPRPVQLASYRNR